MRVMTPELFADICEALHGPNWRPWAAERLRKSLSSIKRYESGDINVPRTVRDGLAAIIREQLTVLQAYERELL